MKSEQVALFRPPQIHVLTYTPGPGIDLKNLSSIVVIAKQAPSSPLTPPAEAISGAPPHSGPPQVSPAENGGEASQLVGEAELQSLVYDLCSNQNEWIASLSFSQTPPPPPPQQPQQQTQHQNQPPPHQSHEPVQQHPQLTNTITPPEIDWVERMKQQVINDMNHFGVCVVDNFLGAERANEIYSEVIRMYQQKNLFHRGQVVNAAGSGGVLVRGDHIAWLDGSEACCSSIRFLIRSLDSIVARCGNQGASAGEMGLYRITQRTKAMLACYPGGGTRYYKHVDNPNFDGRKITCIYYLNKAWDGRRDGGLLRIFPENHRNHVASVEPILDRLVVFWSDRRNPHEVLPSERIRFALTVWYLDDNELAMQKCLNDAGSGTSTHASRCQLLTPFSYSGTPTAHQLEQRQLQQQLSHLGDP
ncbi:egl nine1-like [Tropilaelaps mercedesae]|uniref:hypoxia-inducible factor-proline dioxygenase n=1 Tax=Tropilaelaps mercedesae TaxID=418985 RepID=A0A1V9WY56_9ACAR|nr:egl nine1-like [Tropilaelaps mercedesae]